MTLNLRMVLQAESAAAKAALEDTARGVKGVTTATEAQARASKTATTAADAETAAKRRNALASEGLARSNQLAAGSMGNLVANFNDIGMMLAAGQNPLQLASQQGTQITQVIGPMGAAGAAKALGAAFVGMINPINLITLGVIGFGAAAVQWLTGASADAAALTEELERQQAALAGIVAETEKLRLARGMLTSGAQSEDEQILVEEINRLLEERRRISQELERQETATMRAAGIGAQTVAQAKQQELQAEIAALDAKIASLNAQRELNTATETGRAIAEQLKLATSGVTAALKSADGSRLTAAFAAAFPTANALLGIAQSIVTTIGAASFDYGTLGDDERGSQREGRRSVGELRSRQAVSARLAGMGRAGAPGGGGGGASAAQEEADALQELIDNLSAEIEALRVTDPIQKEMLQHREALAGATDTERQKVEELIATREREKAAMEAIASMQAFKEDLVEEGLDALITKSASLKEVLDQVIVSLMKAVVQAAIFGSGPVAGLFGGGGGIGALIFGGKAEGGMVHGPGTGTSDSIPTMLSNGEYVVNARSTAKNRHLLEMINAGGSVRGLATGGYVGSDTRRSGARGQDGGAVRISIDLSGARGDREIQELARKGTEAALRDYDRNALPASVRRLSNDPRRTG